MKITKARLKQIVKEETEKILTEAPDGLGTEACRRGRGHRQDI